METNDRMFRKSSFIILLILMTAFFLNTDLFASPADTTSILDNIYNYNFAKASRQISSLESSDIFSARTLQLEIEWWKAVSGDDKEKFSAFLDDLGKYEKQEHTSLSELISTTYRVRYNACMGRQIVIPFLLVKIRFLVEASANEVKEKRLSGEYELFVFYKSFLDLMFNRLIKEKILPNPARDELLTRNMENMIVSGSSQSKTIGRYFLMKYYLDIDKNRPKALVYLTDLHNEYPNNLIFTQLLTNN